MKDLRYVPDVKNTAQGIGRGRYQNPDAWVTGPDPIRRDKYYAWMKHKAQANFRGEKYELEWEDFEALWFDDDKWFKRGRTNESLCMSLIDYKLGWIKGNVEVITRLEQLRKPKHNVRSKL